MYRMERRDYGWQCAHPNCKNMIDKNGYRIKQEGDNRPDDIRNPDRAGKHGLYYSMIECRYSEDGPPPTAEEFIRRIGEAAKLLRDVEREHEQKKAKAEAAEAGGSKEEGPQGPVRL